MNLRCNVVRNEKSSAADNFHPALFSRKLVDVVVIGRSSGLHHIRETFPSLMEQWCEVADA
jgi:hypothetical protein